MRQPSPGVWLSRLRATTTFIFIASLCLAVAVTVIALIPGSPVTQSLPSAALTGLDTISGVARNAAVDPAGRIPFTLTDPSLSQRLLHLATILPGLLLIAEISRRMADLLRTAQDNDPFTTRTVAELGRVAKLTALAGLGVWVVAQVAHAVLAATILSSTTSSARNSLPADASLLAWLAVALIFAVFAQLITRGVALRAELDTVI